MVVTVKWANIWMDEKWFVFLLHEMKCPLHKLTANYLRQKNFSKWIIGVLVLRFNEIADDSNNTKNDIQTTLNDATRVQWMLLTKFFNRQLHTHFESEIILKTNATVLSTHNFSQTHTPLGKRPKLSEFFRFVFTQTWIREWKWRNRRETDATIIDEINFLWKRARYYSSRQRCFGIM